MINKILNEDCLTGMKSIPDQSIDLIMSDLPYGSSYCSWDKILPMDKLWEQYKRIIKPNRAIVLFGTEPFASKVRMSNMDQYKYDWVWIKNRPGDRFNAKNRPMSKHEVLMVFSDGVTANVTDSTTKMVYFPQDLESCSIKKDGRYGAWDSTKRPSHGEYIQKFTNYPNSVLVFDKDKDHFHNTQKPVSLCEYIIKTYTNPGDVVLDSCAGSGSTLVAAKNVGRNYIGFEINEEYYKICESRLA